MAESRDDAGSVGPLIQAAWSAALLENLSNRLTRLAPPPDPSASRRLRPATLVEYLAEELGLTVEWLEHLPSCTTGCDLFVDNAGMSTPTCPEWYGRHCQ